MTSVPSTSKSTFVSFHYEGETNLPPLEGLIQSVSISKNPHLNTLFSIIPERRAEFKTALEMLFAEHPAEDRDMWTDSERDKWTRSTLSMLARTVECLPDVSTQVLVESGGIGKGNPTNPKFDDLSWRDCATYVSQLAYSRQDVHKAEQERWEVKFGHRVRGAATLGLIALVAEDLKKSLQELTDSEEVQDWECEQVGRDQDRLITLNHAEIDWKTWGSGSKAHWMRRFWARARGTRRGPIPDMTLAEMLETNAYGAHRPGNLHDETWLRWTTFVDEKARQRRSGAGPDILRDRLDQVAEENVVLAGAIAQHETDSASFSTGEEDVVLNAGVITQSGSASTFMSEEDVLLAEAISKTGSVSTFMGFECDPDGDGELGEDW